MWQKAKYYRNATEQIQLRMCIKYFDHWRLAKASRRIRESWDIRKREDKQKLIQENRELGYQLNRRQFKIASEQIVSELIGMTIEEFTQEVALRYIFAYKNHDFLSKEVTLHISENIVEE